MRKEICEMNWWFVEKKELNGGDVFDLQGVAACCSAPPRTSELGLQPQYKLSHT